MCVKLHENERKWTEGGRVPTAPFATAYDADKNILFSKELVRGLYFVWVMSQKAVNLSCQKAQ